MWLDGAERVQIVAVLRGGPTLVSASETLAPPAGNGSGGWIDGLADLLGPCFGWGSVPDLEKAISLSGRPVRAPMGRYQTRPTSGRATPDRYRP